MRVAGSNTSTEISGGGPWVPAGTSMCRSLRTRPRESRAIFVWLILDSTEPSARGCLLSIITVAENGTPVMGVTKTPGTIVDGPEYIGGCSRTCAGRVVTKERSRTGRDFRPSRMGNLHATATD